MARATLGSLHCCTTNQGPPLYRFFSISALLTIWTQAQKILEKWHWQWFAGKNRRHPVENGPADIQKDRPQKCLPGQWCWKSTIFHITSVEMPLILIFAEKENVREVPIQRLPTRTLKCELSLSVSWWLQALWRHWRRRWKNNWKGFSFWGKVLYNIVCSKLFVEGTAHKKEAQSCRSPRAAVTSISNPPPARSLHSKMHSGWF